MNTNYQLPEAIEKHFSATNNEDSATLLSTFHDDAVVIDAGKEYRGKAAIKEFSDKIYFGDHLQFKITNVVQDMSEIVVTAISDGDFDKTGIPDPLYLDLHFILKEAKVSLLRIVLSSNSRAISLPQSIATFYHASDVRDVELLTDCFKEDAILHDEGKEYLGSAAISEYITQMNKEAKVIMDITNSAEQNGETIVTAMLAGGFEGSPLPLDFHFTLEDGEKIKTLNITPAGE